MFLILRLCVSSTVNVLGALLHWAYLEKFSSQWYVNSNYLSCHGKEAFILGTDLCFQIVTRSKTPEIPGREQQLLNIIQTGSIPGTKIVEHIDDVKGRGVVATKKFKRGEILCLYEGNLKSKAEGLKLEKKYDIGGNYIFYFEFGGKEFCIDATAEPNPPTLGRLINHSSIKDANLKPNVMAVEGIPTVYFVCTKAIEPETEFQYDYGERRREVLLANPYLRF